MITTPHRYTIQEALDVLGKTQAWLIDETKLSVGAVNRAVDNSRTGLKTHKTTAEAIARALGLKVEDLVWPRGISENGRRAHTASDCVGNGPKSVANVCTTCFLELPITGSCGECAA